MLAALATVVLAAPGPASAVPTGKVTPASIQDPVLYEALSSDVDGCHVSTYASWVHATNTASITTEVTNPQLFHLCKVDIQLQFRLAGNASLDDPTVHGLQVCAKSDWTCPSRKRVSWTEDPAPQPANLAPLVEQITIDQYQP